ncbi:MAG: hypothetical protein IT432_05005 [Phycisphaerales bacterium]|nr:hypothetical protein [Phycisphaerales bacterium]
MQLMLWDWLAKPIVEGLRKLAGGSRSREITPAPGHNPKRRPATRRKPPQTSQIKTTATVPKAKPPTPESATSSTRAARRPRRETAADRHDRVIAEMVVRYGVKVRRWRKSMSGVAYEIEYRDGTRKRLIESPRPRSPLSMAIFLHEIGHHAIGLGKYKPRCLEEYHAWMFSLRAMEENGLEVTDKVRTRVKRSLEYAVSKAARRGIKNLPLELHEYIPERMRR